MASTLTFMRVVTPQSDERRLNPAERPVRNRPLDGKQRDGNGNGIQRVQEAARNLMYEKGKQYRLCTELLLACLCLKRTWAASLIRYFQKSALRQCVPFQPATVLSAANRPHHWEP